ncbi:MAG: glycogen/starch synthase [Desulfobacterales bacterium]|nr:glycogen/starch synthase [Desulfobacterales bacterium]
MAQRRTTPRLLIVTPEVAYLPKEMGDMANYLSAKAGSLGDISASLINALFEKGIDVHIALPDYRSIFNARVAPLIAKEIRNIRKNIPENRIHLAEDRAFFYRDSIYHGDDNALLSISFQREVMNNIIPLVQPDIIHCHGWMTGLIPGMARHMGIPCLFTVHNIRVIKSTLSFIEDKGIDALACWKYFYYERMPISYEESLENNNVDFLISGIFGAHFVNTVSPTFLQEIICKKFDFIDENLRRELKNKWNAGCATGILNAPAPSFNPSTDKTLYQNYNPNDHKEGKNNNKIKIQEQFGLIKDENAPLFFWPSRLDNENKGSQLLVEILYKIISKYWNNNLQVIFVTNGRLRSAFSDLVNFHGFHNRVAICDFDDKVSRQAFAASDFIFMPSFIEPCGLYQMIAIIYGALPIIYDTGGLRDTVSHLDVKNNNGNGFVFKHFDSNGLFWAVTQAMEFFCLPQDIKEAQIKRIMEQGLKKFNYSVTVDYYVDLYEKMLKRPLLNSF